MGEGKGGGDCCEEIEKLGNRKRQSCLSSLYEKEKFPSLKKRGQGRFWVKNVQSIMDSLVEWE